MTTPVERRDVWIALGLGAAALAYLLPLRAHGLSLNDDGYWMQSVLRMQAGEILYRDIWTFYAPGTYHAIEALFAATGPSFIAVRTCFAILIAVSAACGFLVARRLAPRAVAVLPASVYALAPGPWHKSFYGACTALFFLAFARALEAPSAARFACAGGLAGLTLITRQDLGLAQILLAIGAALAPGLVPRRGAAREFAAPLRRAAAALAAFSLPVAVTVAYYGMHGALGDLVEATLVRAFTQSGAHPNALLRLFEPGTLGVAPEGRAVGALMLLPLALYPIALAQLLVRIRRNGVDAGGLLRGGVLAYAIATLGQAYYPMLLLRFLQSALPFYWVAAWLAAEGIEALRARGHVLAARTTYAATAGSGLLLVYGVVFALPEVRQPVYTGSARMLRLAQPIDVLGESIREGWPLAEEVRLVRAFYERAVPADEPTLALPTLSLYPVLLGRANATRYLADHPTGDFTMTAEQKRGELARLLASPTRHVVIEQSYYARPGPPDPLLAALRDEFHPVRGYGNVLILRRGSDPAWRDFATRLRHAIATGPRPDAVPALQRFADTHPVEPLAWRMLGLARQASGNPAGAIEALHRAADLDPADAALLETSAQLLARSGKRDEALADLRRAQAVRDSDAIRKLAQALGAPSL